MKTAVFFLGQLAVAKAFVLPNGGVTSPVSLSAKKQSDEIPTEEVDVVVIGSGLAGLSCAALLSHCDKKCVVLEAHDTPGGAVRLLENLCFVTFDFFNLKIISHRDHLSLYVHHFVSFMLRIAFG